MRVVLGAGSLTTLFFLVLPFMQAIGRGPEPDTTLRRADTTALPPPPPPEPEVEKETEPEPERPELEEQAEQPLDLAQMELLLNPGAGGGWGSSEFAVKLDRVDGKTKDVDALFTLADLDQEPRVVYRANPDMDPTMRRKTPATVRVVFVVDQNGRVDSPIVQKGRNPVDPAFESAAVAAVKKWRFEPGKRNGKPVRFRMRLPITFPDK